MFRVAVATYLMLVQFAGPLLCCCSTPRAAPSAAQAPAAQPSPSGHSCCGSHATKADRQHAPAGPQPCERRDCPCQQGSDRLAVLPAQAAEAVKQLQQRDVAPVLLAPSALSVDGCPLPGALQASEAPRAFPFLTADDILRALHILRC
jgi:hypothetical protein